MQLFLPGKLWLCVLTLLAASPAALPADEPVVWLTGPALKKKLDLPLIIDWADKPLRDAIHGLSRAHQTAMLLDRRIDPSQPVELKLRDIPLRDALAQIAMNRGLGHCLLESVVYFGPPETARQLRTLAAIKKEELGKLPAARRLELARVKVSKWPDLAMPREFVSQVGKDASLQVRGLELIPHDLWAAADLPALSAIDRLLLLCAEFDLSFTWEEGGAAVQLTAWPTEVSIERTYAGSKQPDEFAEQLRLALPDNKIDLINDKVVVRGLLEQHEMIEAARTSSGKTVAAAPASLDKTRVEQFKVQNKAIKTVLESFRQQLGLEIRYDEAQIRQSGRSLDTLISLDLKNVSVDELIEKSLTAAGLTGERKDRILEVRGKK